MSKLKKILLILILAILTVATNTTVFASTKDILETLKDCSREEIYNKWKIKSILKLTFFLMFA